MTYAERSPMSAVSGAETAATSMVVKRLSHAEPVHRRPKRPQSTLNADAKWRG
jgi:hypothetical protein